MSSPAPFFRGLPTLLNPIAPVRGPLARPSQDRDIATFIKKSRLKSFWGENTNWEDWVGGSQCAVPGIEVSEAM